MTIDELNALGANTKEGLARCAGKEAFYLQLIPKALDAGKYTELDNLLKEKKYDITGVSHTGHAIDSVVVAQAHVTHVDQVNLRIYLPTN